MKEGWVEQPARPGQGARKKGEVRINSGYAANGARLTDIVARDFQVCFRLCAYKYKQISIQLRSVSLGLGNQLLTTPPSASQHRENSYLPASSFQTDYRS